MLKAINGNTFHPHRIIPSFSIKVGEKTIGIEVEVVDTLLDYNILLNHSWTYSMEVMVFSIYRVIKFPYQGKIMTIDQL